MNNTDKCPKCGASLISEEIVNHECVIDVSNIMLDTGDPDHILICISNKWLKISWKIYEYFINRKFTGEGTNRRFDSTHKQVLLPLR